MSPSDERHRTARWRVSLVSLAVSGALLVSLYSQLDLRAIGDTFRRANLTWLLVALFMIAPITVLRAVRFYWAAPARSIPGPGEALRLTLVATALNAFLPAKTGDLIKSYFVSTRGGTSAGVALGLIVYERLCDVVGLLVWCTMGSLVPHPLVERLPDALWLFFGVLGVTCAVVVLSERVADRWRRATQRLLPGRFKRLHELADGWPDLLATLRGRRAIILAFSVFLWLVHLIQIWMFTIALAAPIPFTVCASLSAVALMAGQVPFTVAGIGARDVALVALLAGYVPRETAAALGIVIATRNLLPPLAALPIMRPYVAAVVDQARAWRAMSRPTTAVP